MALGDLAIFIASLWLSLSIRYWTLPSSETFSIHLDSFAPVFALWICFFVLGGLYDRHLRFLRSKLASKLWMAQVINVIAAFAYFYLLKTSSVANGLTPKTILVVYLLVSSFLITIWRIYVYVKITKIKPLRVVCVGDGIDYDRIAESKTGLLHSGMDVVPLNSVDAFVAFINNKENARQIDIIVSNSYDPQFKAVSTKVYDLLFAGVTYIDLSDFYEEVFEMIPLQAIDESWFLKYVSVRRRYMYDLIKRLMDIAVALPLAIISLIFYPFVILARKIENLGPIIIKQARIGESGKIINIIKFSSMTVNDAGKVIVKGDNRITPVGAFIRKTRIDELPQLWNVLRGDISLIGPRPEMPNLVEFYKGEIPHYNVRHIIKPGLSGWAQIHHDSPPQSVEATKQKLAYDLYYIKNRSLVLDLKIAFATIKTLLSRTGL